MLNIEFESTELILCTEQIISNKSLDADKILFQILRLPFPYFVMKHFKTGKLNIAHHLKPLEIIQKQLR